MINRQRRPIKVYLVRYRKLGASARRFHDIISNVVMVYISRFVCFLPCPIGPGTRCHFIFVLFSGHRRLISADLKHATSGLFSKVWVLLWPHIIFRAFAARVAERTFFVPRYDGGSFSGMLNKPELFGTISALFITALLIVYNFDKFIVRFIALCILRGDRKRSPQDETCLAAD